MRRVVSALALALLAAACSSSPCQDLGEKLCACTGATKDTCKTQVEQQLKSVDLSDDRCDQILAQCNDNKPANADFCEWLLTEDGKTMCGLAPPPSP